MGRPNNLFPVGCIQRFHLPAGDIVFFRFFSMSSMYGILLRLRPPGHDSPDFFQNAFDLIHSLNTFNPLQSLLWTDLSPNSVLMVFFLNFLISSLYSFLHYPFSVDPSLYFQKILPFTPKTTQWGLIRIILITEKSLLPRPKILLGSWQYLTRTLAVKNLNSRGKFFFYLNSRQVLSPFLHNYNSPVIWNQ